MIVGVQKGTKNALETGRTFATLFADMDLRLRLLGARSEDEFKQLMWEHMRELADEQCDGNAGRKLSGDSTIDGDDEIASIVSAVTRAAVLWTAFYRLWKMFVFIGILGFPSLYFRLASEQCGLVSPCLSFVSAW